MIELRAASPADRETVFGLVRAYFAYDGLVYTPSVEAALDELLANRAYGRLFLAFLCDEIVGYAALTYGFDPEAGGRTGVVTDLFLVEAARGQRLGRKLLDAILEIARAEALRQVELWVIDGNARAAALYRSRGFARIEGRGMMAHKLEV